MQQARPAPSTRRARPPRRSPDLEERCGPAHAAFGQQAPELSTGAGRRVLTDDDGIVWIGAWRRSSWHRWSPLPVWMFHSGH
jgi:hypothetical protein